MSSRRASDVIYVNAVGRSLLNCESVEHFCVMSDVVVFKLEVGVVGS